MDVLKKPRVVNHFFKMGDVTLVVFFDLAQLDVCFHCAFLTNLDFVLVVLAK